MAAMGQFGQQLKLRFCRENYTEKNYTEKNTRKKITRKKYTEKITRKKLHRKITRKRIIRNRGRSERKLLPKFPLKSPLHESNLGKRTVMEKMLKENKLNRVNQVINFI